MDWTHGLLIMLLLAVILALIKSSSFNVIDYLKWKDERREKKFVETCPHGTIHVNPDSVEICIESWFFSPPGAILYLCKRCGAEAYEAQVRFVQEQLARRAMRAAEKAGISTEGWTLKEMERFT